MCKKKSVFMFAIATTLALSTVSGYLPRSIYAQENESEVTTFANELSSFDISKGSISIVNNAVTMNGVSVNVDGPIVLTGSSSENTIEVSGDVDLVFNNLNVSTNSKDQPLVNIVGGNVKIELVGNNALKNVGGENACLRVSNSANLVLEGLGALNIKNGENSNGNSAYGAGIGGNYQEAPASITIHNGNITVVEYGTAAAIGGGAQADSGEIIISGGNIDVQVYDGGDLVAGTGIGGGSEGYKGSSEIGTGGSADVSIIGGKVNAMVKPHISEYGPSESGAAIGAGQNQGGNIYIGANAIVNAKVWGQSAAIGAGAGVFSSGGNTVDPPQDDPGSIIIEGNAQVSAETFAVDYFGEPYPSGAAIGAGNFNHQYWDIVIKGNANVYAKNGAYSAGIGGSFENSYPMPVSVTISENAVVNASSDWFGAGIGTGRAQTPSDKASSVTISGNANVKAYGGKGGFDLNGGAGIGAGSESWIESITISDQVNVLAVGGSDASAIGGAISTERFGNIIIGNEVNLKAYADGTLFAIDTRFNVENIKTSMLNARFVEAANEADLEKLFYVELDGNKDEELTLPANYRSFATTTSIHDNENHNVHVKSEETIYAYYPENDSKFVQYEIKNQEMLTTDNLNWVNNVNPQINATDKILTVGDTFNPYKDVTATDKEDGDITGKIDVLKNSVDTNRVGEYEVTYEVIDSLGLKATKTIVVTVKEKETIPPIDPEIPENPDPTPDPEVPVDPIDPVDPVEPVDPIDPITPVDPVDPVEPAPTPVPVGPVTPIQPDTPLDPIDPEDIEAPEDIEDEETPQTEDEDIAGEKTPLTNLGSWALVNLISMILTVLGGLLLLLSRHKKEEENEESEEVEAIKTRRRWTKVVGTVVGIASVVAFFLTEDMSLKMVMTDKWTILMVVMLLVEIVTLVLGKWWKKEEPEEENQ